MPINYFFNTLTPEIIHHTWTQRKTVLHFLMTISSAG